MLEVLAQAATALHDQPDLDALLTWSVRAAARAVGADDAAICAFSPDGGCSWTPMEAYGSAFESIGDPRIALALMPALADGREVALAGAAVTDLLPGGLWSWVVGLRVARPGDTPRGLLLVGGRGRAPSPSELAPLVSHIAVALENHDARHRLQVSQRQMVHRLQEALLPPPPPLEHAELGRYYSGAENQHSTGGDLYDWLVLPDGSLHFCIVDIMGKGVAATKDAVAVTHVLRLLVLDGCELGSVVARADSILTLQNPELVATAIVGRYWPDSGVAELAGAGHPPALLVSGGQVESVAAPGIPIGWPGAGSQGTVTVGLDHMASLVLYTDGLIEAGRDILAGLDALAEHVAKTADYPADHQARALVDRSLDGAARYDDSLALVIRRRSSPQGPVLGMAPFRHAIGSSSASVPLARHLLGDWLKFQPIEDNVREDLLLAASELCTNALRHGGKGQWAAVLRASVEGADVLVEVDDPAGNGIDLEGIDEIPDTDALSGRGLFLVGALMDEVTVLTHAEGKTVRCRKRDALRARL